ncbi:glycosyl hydrolase family 28-related protein [Streptomyces sp. NPDC050095]|uniref:right-handed parallel beta-helix repeat-containing protein n=1 Tax=unclassified Streptomyces TaxID=2593676 RepID=UPI003445AF65
MARYEFGSGAADFVVRPSDGLWGVGANVTVTFWDSVTEGAQHTDLQDASSAPIKEVVSDEYGSIPRFFGPDGVTGMWADSGGAYRVWVEAHSVTSGESHAGSVRDWLNVRDFGAKGDNVTDDTLAIQAALAAAPMGGIVYLPAGAYRTSAPLTIPPAVTLQATHTNLMTVPGLTDPPCYIRPLASFQGTAVIMLVDAATGGYSTISAEHRILDVMIDGQDLPAGSSVDGLSAKGNIQNVGLRDFTVRQCTGNGIYCGENAGINPYSWRLHRVMLDNNHGHGLSVQVMTDLTMIDCQAIGNFADGFRIINAANSQALGCRAEWNGNNGYHLTGDWATGTGSGGMLLSGCSTDRNGFNGVLVDAAGNAPLQFENLHTRRDGRNGGAGGGEYAGFKVDGATVPVIAGVVTCYPGVDDNGAQTNSPQYGVRVANSKYVSVAAGFLHAATAGWSDGGGNTALRRGLNIGERTGTTAAPVDAFAAPADVGGNLNVGGYLAAASGQSGGVWNIWDATAKALNLGTAGGGVAIKEGGNKARMGQSVLAAGTVAVANTSVGANTRVATFRQALGGTAGHLSVTKNNGAGFTIMSSSNTDTSTIAWVLFEAD